MGNQWQGFLSAAMPQLVVNYIVIYDFCDSVADVVHLINPLHLIIHFELFGHTFTFCHLFYKPKKHILSLLVNVSRIAI